MIKTELFSEWNFKGCGKSIRVPFAAEQADGNVLTRNLPGKCHTSYIEFGGVPYLTDLYLDGKFSKTILFERELIKIDGNPSEAALHFHGKAALTGHVYFFKAESPVYVIPYGLSTVFASEGPDGATVNAKAEILNDGKKRRVSVNFAVYRNGTKRIARRKKSYTLEPGMRTVEVPINIKKYLKYGDGSVKKYTLKVTLSDGTGILDVSETEFGITKPYTCTKKLIAASVPSEKGIYGKLGSPEHERRVLRSLQDLGYNAVRFPSDVSEAALNAADDLGMKVIAELFENWTLPDGKTANHLLFDAEYLKRTGESIRYLRNHPSVVMYSVCSTAPEADEKGLKYAGDILSVIKYLDGTRPVTCADGPEKLNELLDVAGSRSETEDPGKPVSMLVSEQKDFFPASYGMLKNASLCAVTNLKAVGTGGDIDASCLPTPYGLYKAAYIAKAASSAFTSETENPDLGTYKPVWDYEDGQEISVKVVTPGEVVALYLNDRIIGRRLAGKPNRFIASFTVPFEKGKLEAICYAKGKETGRSILTTPEKARYLKLLSGRKTLHMSEGEISFIDIWAVDRKGNVSYSLDGEILETVTGEGIEAEAAGNAFGSTGTGKFTLMGGHAVLAVKGTKTGKYPVCVRTGKITGQLTLSIKE